MIGAIDEATAKGKATAAPAPQARPQAAPAAAPT
jgi:hypothetical protein